MSKTLKIILSATLGMQLAVCQAAPSKKTDYGQELLFSRFSSWGVDPEKHLASINLKNAWANFKKNKDIVVAVIDTGIEIDHPFLAENIHVVSGKKNKDNYGVDFSSKKVTRAPSDQHGHGTHIAGIIKSVFPGVKILSLKYYSPKFENNVDATIQALKYAVDKNVDIINYSGGGAEATDDELRVLKEAEKKGILVIAAAGNKGSDIDQKANAFYPASYALSNIITVTAHDDALNIIPSSNYGKNSVDIAAPGHQIRSAIPGNRAGYMTGTSQATAFVSGVAAMIKAKYPLMKYDQIKNIILSSSLKVKNFEDKVTGSGKLDATRAMELADSIQQKLHHSPARAIANQR